MDANNKPGYKTTEFWLSLLATVAGTLVAMLPADNQVARIAGIVVAVLAQLGYVASRTSVKNNLTE